MYLSLYILVVCLCLGPAVFAEKDTQGSDCAQQVKNVPPLRHGDIDAIDHMKRPTSYQPNLAGLTFIEDHKGIVLQGSSLDEYVLRQQFEGQNTASEKPDKSPTDEN